MRLIQQFDRRYHLRSTAAIIERQFDRQRAA